jgi:hypothetical protein
MGFIPPLAGEARRGIDTLFHEKRKVFIPPLTPPARGRTEWKIKNVILYEITLTL